MSCDLKPDAVFTVATDAQPDSPTERLIPGYEDAARTFSNAGIDVIGIRDNARFAKDKASCVSLSGADSCTFLQSDNLAATNPAETLESIDRVHMIDLTDQYCRDGLCHAVVGNVLVYMDNHHLTADFASTMSTALGERIAAATGWDMK
ncbi:SGNH hydrolase domain-containing protein [Arthrobacter psychrolactophilus]